MDILYEQKLSFVENIRSLGKYVCIIVTVVLLTYLKVETGCGYPVPKMDNATNHYNIHGCTKND